MVNMALSEVMPLIDEAESKHKELSDILCESYKRCCLRSAVPSDKLKQLIKQKMFAMSLFPKQRCSEFLGTVQYAKAEYRELKKLNRKITNFQKKQIGVAPQVKAYMNKYPDISATIIELDNKAEECIGCYIMMHAQKC